MLDGPGSWPARGFGASGAADDKALQVRGSQWQPTRSSDAHTVVLGEAQLALHRVSKRTTRTSCLG